MSRAVSEADSGAATAVTAPRRPRRSPAVLAVLTAAVLAVLLVPLVTGLQEGARSYTLIGQTDPGRTTTVLTTIARAVAELSSLVTVGALVSLLLLGRAHLQPGRGRQALEVDEWFEISLVRRAGLLWAVASLCLVVLEAADSNGLPVAQVLEPNALWFALFSGQYARAWAVALVAALAVWLTAHLTVRWSAYVVSLGAALVGVLSPVVVGQVLVGPNHDFGGDADVYLTVATWLVLGSLAVIALRTAAGRRTGAGWSRWLAWARVGLPLMLATELVVDAFELAGTSPTASATGRFMLVRLLALVALTATAYLPWRSPVVSRPRLLGMLAAAGAYAACGVAMTRVSPPVFFVHTSVPQILLGYDVPQPPSFARLVGHWRPDLLFAVAAVAAVVGYLMLVRRARRRGTGWPVTRTLSWVLGWVVVVFVTSAGVGTYAGADFAVHMAVHMVLNMLAPVFLVLGGPVTLALRAFPAARPDEPVGPHEWISALLHSRFLSVLYHPLLVFVLYVGSYYGLYVTGLFGVVMKFHWAHQLMNVHFLLIGVLYFGLVIGVDPVPHKLPQLAKFGYLLAAMPFHAFFGVIVMSGGDLIGGTFYRYLDLPWAHDLAGTQKLAGGIAWAGGEVPLLVVVIVLALQWAAQDDREARRTDRHIDAGLDESYDAYNAMFERLAQQSARQEAASRGERGRLEP